MYPSRGFHRQVRNIAFSVKLHHLELRVRKREKSISFLCLALLICFCCWCGACDSFIILFFTSLFIPSILSSRSHDVNFDLGKFSVRKEQSLVRAFILLPEARSQSHRNWIRFAFLSFPLCFQKIFGFHNNEKYENLCASTGHFLCMKLDVQQRKVRFERKLNES